MFISRFIGAVLATQIITAPLLATQERVHREMVEALEAYAAYKMGNYREAFEAWLVLAQKGNSQGILNVAHMYQAGEGVERDPTQALYWYQRGANQGDPLALYQLALAHEKGLGTPADQAKAREYLQLAAEAGATSAQGRLGREYFLAGEGDEARYWLRRAAEGGDAEALANLARLEGEAASNLGLPTPGVPLSPGQRSRLRTFIDDLNAAANARDAAWLTAAVDPTASIHVRLPGQADYQTLTKDEFQALWQATFDRSDRYRFTRARFDIQRRGPHWVVQSAIKEYLTRAATTQQLILDERLELRLDDGEIAIDKVVLDVQRAESVATLP
ncbi:MAG: tetratricopeptide repeat protein [Candidatus Competibacterales bacterium]